MSNLLESTDVVEKLATVTELEGLVLALIANEGAATAYAVRQVFLKSPSPEWSGSAGAIYPLVRRLRQRKLIIAAQHDVGARKGLLLSPTPEGRRVVESWIGPPISDLITGVPPDPVRTRVRMLGLLPAKNRLAFLRAAIKATERHLKALRADRDERRSNGGFPYMIAIGAVKSLEARLSWLREVLRLMR